MKPGIVRLMLTSTKWTSEQYTLIEQPPESHVSRLVYTLCIMSLWSAFQIYQIVLGLTNCDISPLSKSAPIFINIFTSGNCNCPIILIWN